MKIIYVENVRIPSERAHAYQIVQQCAWMGREGHDVTLVNPNRTGGKDVFSYFKLPDRWFTHVVLPTVDFLERAPLWLKPIAYRIQRATFIRNLKNWIKTQQADAWYTRDPAMVQALLDRGADRVFLELHHAPDMNRARWERIRNAVSGFIVITQGLRDRLLELGIPEERIHVAPDGYEPEEFQDHTSREEARKALGLPGGAFVVFYGGSFYPWKGLDMIVRSWAQTEAQAHLVLIGGPEPDADRLKKLVPDTAKDRIHILPRRERAELIRLYPAADLGLIASSADADVSARYTSPIKLFEYLAAGLPIIASDVPSSREALDERVAVFFKPTEEGFHHVLREVMDRPVWMRSAAETAPAYVRPYTWQARAEGISAWIAKQ